MREEHPDNWVVIKIGKENPHYKVLAGWSGGYLFGSSWSMNSGIVSAEELDHHINFHGNSGSIYCCGKSSYGLRMNNEHIWHRLKEKYGDRIELMEEDTNWMEIDYES